MDKAANNQFFERAFRDASTGVALLGLDGQFLMVNRALCETFGYTEKELLQRTFQSLTHPLDLDKDLANATALLLGHISSYQIEKRYFRQNGMVIWAQLSASLVRKDDGRPDFYIGHVQDISDKKKAEQERDIFFNMSSDMLAIVSPNGYLKQVNHAWKAVLEWSDEELVSAPFSHFIHAGDRQNTTMAITALRQGNYKGSFINRLAVKSGGFRWIEWTSGDAKNCVLYVAGRDITEQRESQSFLEQSNDNLLELLNYLPAMISYWDKELINQFANRAYQNWFGISSADMKGMHIRDVLGDELYKFSCPHINEVLKGEPQLFERVIENSLQNKALTKVFYLPDKQDTGVIGFYVMITAVH